MALVLRLRPGEDFYVDHQHFLLDAIIDEKRAILRHGTRRIEIDFDHDTEILPGVHVTLGERRSTIALPISIDAPRQVAILSGQNYRASGGVFRR